MIKEIKTIRKWTCKDRTYELEHGYASYCTLVEHVCGNIILCNDITEVDENLLCNVEAGSLTYCTIDEDEYNDDEELKETYESYQDLVDSCDYEEYVDVFQYYLTSMTSDDIRYLNKYFPNELIVCYSEVLNLYVLCVTHYGTSWDYVLTDVKIVE